MKLVIVQIDDRASKNPKVMSQKEKASTMDQIKEAVKDIKKGIFLF